eukprot:scaffold12976_cov121-Skeletonema_dohrnii-CCMP3373.AAC.1
MEPHTPKKTRRKRGRGPKKSAEAATDRNQEKAQPLMATEKTAAAATVKTRQLQEEEDSEEEELKGISDLSYSRSDDNGDAASGDQPSDDELPSDIDSDDGSDDVPAASNPPTARGSDEDDYNVSDASEQPATKAT